MPAPFGRPSALVLATLKAAVLVGLLSVAAAEWLSDAGLDRSALRHLAGQDPSTTGSVAEGAERARLDPCAAPPRR